MDDKNSFDSLLQIEVTLSVIKRCINAFLSQPVQSWLDSVGQSGAATAWSINSQSAKKARRHSRSGNRLSMSWANAENDSSQRLGGLKGFEVS
jgi:hypothetical protein